MRKKISDAVEAEVMFKSNRECCVCDKRGDHIHHIDEDSSNGKFENLALLCFDCHSEASMTGSLRKKLSAATIIKYRTHKYEVIQTVRENSLKLFNSPIKELTTEDLLITCKNAVIIIEIETIKEEYFSAEWDERGKILGKLTKYSDHTNFRLAVDVFSFLSKAADQTRAGMTSDIASSILFNLEEFFPYYEEDDPENKLTAELGYEGIDIAFSICYDTAIYLKNFDVAMWGLTIFKFIYQIAQKKKLPQLIEKINSKYDELESTLQRPERNDLADMIELVKIFRGDIKEGSLTFPSLPDHLMKKVYSGRNG